MRAVAGPGEPFEREVLDASADRDCWYPISCAGSGFAADDRLMLVWTTGGEGSGVLAAERWVRGRSVARRLRGLLVPGMIG